MTFYSDPLVLKHGAVFIPAAWESTPIGLSGHDYLISFKRGWADSSGSGYRVTDIQSGAIVADYPSWAGFLGCAFFDTLNGRIAIFGVNTDASNGNSIMMSVLNSDWSAQPASAVLTAAPTDRFYNCSVCYNGASYLMAVEHASGATTFYAASALSGPWNPIGGSIGSYACPTLYKGSDSLFYCMGASGAPAYRTMVARSNDLVNWSWATKNAGSTVLAADGPGNEYTNASDMDLCDSAANPGSAVICYMVGDQTNASTTSIKIATVPQTVDSFLRGQF